jgi:hypothetical protein
LIHCCSRGCQIRNCRLIYRVSLTLLSQQRQEQDSDPSSVCILRIVDVTMLNINPIVALVEFTGRCAEPSAKSARTDSEQPASIGSDCSQCTPHRCRYGRQAALATSNRLRRTTCKLRHSPDHRQLRPFLLTSGTSLVTGD